MRLINHKFHHDHHDNSFYTLLVWVSYSCWIWYWYS